MTLFYKEMNEISDNIENKNANLLKRILQEENKREEDDNLLRRRLEEDKLFQVQTSEIMKKKLSDAHSDLENRLYEHRQDTTRQYIIQGVTW